VISRYVFDSHALLAFFQGEQGASVVADLLRKILAERVAPLINVINLGEIIYLTKRRFGDKKKIEVIGRIHQLSFKVLPAPNELVYMAAELNAEYPISYADCFALASALEQSAALVTGDPDFQKVSHLVQIEWIR